MIVSRRITEACEIFIFGFWLIATTQVMPSLAIAADSRHLSKWSGYVACVYFAASLFFTIKAFRIGNKAKIHCVVIMLVGGITSSGIIKFITG